MRNRLDSLISNTVWTKFRNQLSDLMADLNKTDTRYIRCIKPNTKKVRAREDVSEDETLARS